MQGVQSVWTYWGFIASGILFQTKMTYKYKAWSKKKKKNRVLYWLLSMSGMWVPSVEKMDSYKHPFLLFIVDGSQTGVYLQALDAKEMMAAIQR